ncbi:hypothetical protein [Luteipulveratus mongoliensis]|nr:hypothetical protein [Luteipulveratus mongoliensis]
MLATVALGTIFAQIGGGLIVALVLAFTVLRNTGPSRWWVVALGGLMTVYGFYLVAA